MRPTPIEDGDVWEGTTRRVIGPPNGDLDSGVAPVEVLTERRPEEGPMLHVRFVIEDDDVRRIIAGDRVFWLTLWGDHLHPFDVQMAVEDLVDVPECSKCGGPLVTGDRLVEGFAFANQEETEKVMAEANQFWFHQRIRDAETCGAPQPKQARRDGKPGPT